MTAPATALRACLEHCRAAQHGFGTAAELVGSSKLRARFHKFELQHARFALALQRLLALYPAQGSHERPEEKDGLSLPKPSARDLLERSLRREESLMQRYRRALSSDLPEDVRRVLNEQLASVEAIRDELTEQLARQL